MPEPIVMEQQKKSFLINSAHCWKDIFGKEHSILGNSFAFVWDVREFACAQEFHSIDLIVWRKRGFSYSSFDSFVL
jgi:hypothetical protein